MRCLASIQDTGFAALFVFVLGIWMVVTLFLLCLRRNCFYYFHITESAEPLSPAGWCQRPRPYPMEGGRKNVGSGSGVD